MWPSELESGGGTHSGASSTSIGLQTAGGAIGSRARRSGWLLSASPLSRKQPDS